MTPDERLSRIQIKVHRAREHGVQLMHEIKTFLDSDPYKIATKIDPDDQKVIYYLTSVHQTPPQLSAIVGDVIQNLRSALDHLAYQLVLAGGGTPSTQTYFPVCDSVNRYKSEKPNKLKGVHPDAVKAIDVIRPYKGGNDVIWQLHKLCNVDKHRLLITVGSAFRSFNMGPLIRPKMVELWEGMGRSGDEVPFTDVFVRPADRMCPLKVGDELFYDNPGSKAKEDLQFVFDIGFSESGVIDGAPVLETLQEMIDTVDSIILSLKPHL